MKRRIYFALVMMGSVGVFGWQASLDAKPRDEMLELYGLFVDAVEKVETNYVRKVSRRELLESALEGMLQNLDPHSTFINSGEWRQFQRQIEGKFGGIGIQVGLDEENGRLKVIAPMVGTPAYDGGILAGDLIVEIDGQSTEGMSTEKAAEFLTGRPGTEVKLSVLHEGAEDPESITINRAIIEVPTVLADRRKASDEWDFMLDKDKKIGYIRITTFSQNTVDELKKALGQLKDEGAKGLILDLRDDPGGLLSAAVAIADIFLDKGEIVSTKGRNTDARRYDAQKDGLYEDIPMAVLINQNSASASEIVSAALQDHKRAVIVGQRSYGKGSVQNIIDLDGGNSVLKLTVASYYRPSGENIHRFKNAKATDKWGVSPDPGAEVKLPMREFINWFRARHDRDQEASAKGHRKNPEAGADADKTKAAADAKPEQQKAAADAKPEQKADAKAENKAAPADNETKNGAGTSARSTRRQPGRFIDKQLDKALEILRGKLADTNAKAA
jgi:carboxyl-terminal processing protease